MIRQGQTGIVMATNDGHYTFIPTDADNNGVITSDDINSVVSKFKYVASTAIQIDCAAGEYVNVKEYGATGDGVTDDTVQIQNAFNSLTSGQCLFFPTGIYRVTASITIPATWSNRISMIGVGYGSQIMQDFDGDVFKFQTMNTQINVNYFECKHMMFFSNAKSTGDIWHIEYTSCVFIRNCFFFNWSANGNAIYINGNTNDSSYCHEIVIENSYFDITSPASGNSCIYADSLASDIKIYDNQSELGFLCKYAVYLNNCGTVVSINNHWSNAAENILKIIGCSSSPLFFNNDMLDSATNDIILVDDSASSYHTEALTLQTCIIYGIKSGYSGIHLIGASYGPWNTTVSTCTFQDAGAGCRSYVREVFSPMGGNTHITDGRFFGTATTSQFELVHSSSFYHNCIPGNPKGYLDPQPSLPATTVAYYNIHNTTCRVFISGGTVTAISINNVTTGLTSGSFLIAPGEYIKITYSNPPAWKWYGL